jgi:hypothetical protein
MSYITVSSNMKIVKTVDSFKDINDRTRIKKLHLRSNGELCSG